MLSEGLTASLNVGYLDTEYDEFILDLNLDGMPDQDLSGRDVTRAPEVTAGLDLTYDTTVGTLGNLRAMTGVYYEDASTFYYAADGPAFDTEIEEHTLINASLTYTHSSDSWYISVFGKNLSDERYRNASQCVGGLWTFSTYAPPRQWGVEVGVSLR